MKTIGIFVLYLQAIIRQMDVFVIWVVRWVSFAGGSDVPLVVHIEVLATMSEGPKSYIKLPPFVEQRLLKVLLNHPVWKLYARFKESDNMVDIIKYFDSFTLVLVSRLYQPHVFMTMLLRYPLFYSLTVSFIKVMESPKKLMVLVGLKIWTQDKSCWRCIENLIIGLYKINIIFVVIFERSNQACLGRKISMALKMVYN